MDTDKQQKDITQQIIEENDKANKINSFRMWHLAIAESIDAWRIVPRTIVILYGVMVAYLMEWYLHLQTFPKIQCAADVLTAALSKGVPLDKAQELACHVVDIVGGPSTSQTAFVTAVISLSSAIFGFYVSTGKDWSKSILPWKFGATKNDSTTPTPTPTPTTPISKS